MAFVEVRPPLDSFRANGLQISGLAGGEAVRFLAFLNRPNDQDDPADHRNEPEQQKPGAAVGVMQASRADGQRRPARATAQPERKATTGFG